MGRCNNAKTQAAAEANKHTASRARFSKPPPKKNTKGGGSGKGGRGGGGGGRGGSEGRGRGGDDGGRGGGSDGGRGGGGRGGGGRGNTKAAASVVRKLAERGQDPTGSKKKAGGGGAANPLSSIDKFQLDELTISEASVNLITQLLMDLNVMDGGGGGGSNNNNGNGNNNQVDDDDAVTSDNEGDDCPETTWEHVPVDEAMQRDPVFCHLTMQLSFSQQDAARAVQQGGQQQQQQSSLPSPAAPAPASTTTTKDDAATAKVTAGGGFDRTQLTNALDWLCLHLEESHLESGFKKNKTPSSGSSSRSNGNNSGVTLGGNMGAATLTSLEERVVGFLRLGFHSAEAWPACEDTDANGKTGSRIEAIHDSKTLRIVMSALERETLGDKASAAQSGTPVDNKGAAAERKMEQEALLAIYGGAQFKVVESGDDALGRWKVKVNPADELKKPFDSQKCELHIFLRPDYPSAQAPLFLLTNPSLPPPFLRHINAAIVREARSNVGVPLVYGIVSFVESNLLSLQRDFLKEQRVNDFEAEQLRLRRAAGHDVKGKLVESSATDIGRNQEARPKAAEKTHGNNGKAQLAVGNSAASSNPSQATPTTPAFMDRLRHMYDDSAQGKTTGAYSLAEAKQQVANEGEKIQEAKSRPRPVAVPVGDLAKVMDEVMAVQNDQPWLVSEEARVAGAASVRDGRTPNQLKRREEISKSLKDALEQKYGTSKGSKKSANVSRPFQKMLDQRQRLPAYKMKDDIVSTIARSQITVIAGDTGCGKTTQVPQLVLDNFILQNKGSEANIIVTQPRRISAIGVSERIASERCEKVGDTCGYSIALEKKTSRKTRLLLCTTGILLRRLQCDPDLASVSHIFVDEVHERDLNTDFLLIILKDLLARRKSLKLVLMSATLNADAFKEFFQVQGCEIVTIPGRAHPVQQFRLEDILQLTKYEVQERSDYAVKSSNTTNRLSKSELKKMYEPKGYGSKVIESLAIIDESVVNYELLAKLLEHIALNSDEGAILVFLPGFMEITKAIDEMNRKEFFQSPQVVIHPLHSSLSTAEQTAVFVVPPAGVRKVVVATNIAETSITIEDVVYVVDAGRVKENRRDEVKETPALVECWVSRASAKQRRGRAGRVRPGVAYHMFSSHTHDTELQDYQLPEMLRVGLEDLALQILILDLGEPSEFLAMAMNPPSAVAMRNSLKLLEQLGALECTWGKNKAPIPSRGSNAVETESCAILSVKSELTALGFHLAMLPVEPRVGKMMIYGALFGCIEPALTIAASMSSKNPFVSPFENRDAADEARQQFSTEDSDHLTVLTAFNEWKDVRRTNGERAAKDFLRDNFLSRMTLFQMDDLRKQYSQLLVGIGFLPRGFQLAGKGGQQQGKNPQQLALGGANANASNLALVKAVLCAGLYPNILVAPSALVDGSSKQEAGACAFESHNKGDVFLHPSTISFKSKLLESRYCCFHEIVKTKKTYVRDCTTVSPFALVLFGGALEVYQREGIVTVDEWLKFRISPKPATLVKHLRAQMESMLLRKIIAPEDDVTESPEAKAVIASISALLARGGHATKAPVQPKPQRNDGGGGGGRGGRSNGGQSGGGRGRGSSGGGRGRGGRGRGRS